MLKNDGLLNTMKRTIWYSCALLLVIAMSSTAGAEEPPLLQFGGCGGVYFLVEPGEFWVEVEKRDIHTSKRNTILRAILAGPDRVVLGDEYLEGNGRVRLRATVARTGVYGLNITVSEDRYGEHIAWGFRSNCPRYLVETSRGHRDAPHEEPLVLLSPDASGDICFLPERRAFTIEISGLPPSGAPVTLHDAADQLIAALQADDAGAVRADIAVDVDRNAIPWRLHLPVFQAVVHVDGVTRWPDGCDYPNLSLWTPHAASWFPLHEHRWLITPYSRTVYAEAGDRGTVTFGVHNNGAVQRRYALSLEFPEQPWPLELKESELTVPPGESAAAALHYTTPETGDAWRGHVRVTPLDTPGLSTYATLALRRGIAPAVDPLEIPLALKPYHHENERFGYSPEYRLDNQVYFDGLNRPYIVSQRGVFTRRGDAWVEMNAVERPDGALTAFRTRSSKAAFDTTNNVYLLGEIAGETALLYADSGAMAFRACALPGRGAFDMEQFSGHNTPVGPPPLARYTLTARDPKLIWRRLNDLDLLLPERGADGVLTPAESVPISKKCIGFSAHSGIPSSVVSRDGKVHVAWAEATEPEENAPGVPTFAVTYDRNTKTLGAPALVGYGPPANDVHNTPCITMDSQGYLHVLVGTHGRTFKYARSLQPNDAGGWTEAEDIGPGLRQTYIGLVCGKDDVLHAVFRLWRDDREYFPASHYATLAYMSKRPGEAWSEARPLIISAFSEYSVFYHRLTIDRQSRLFLSYDYWSTYWFYRNDHRGNRRALMMSPDGGNTWQLAALEHLLP